MQLNIQNIIKAIKTRVVHVESIDSVRLKQLQAAGFQVFIKGIKL